MTAKEFVIKNYPELLNDDSFGGVDRCTQTPPCTFNIKALCENDKETICRETCTACWNQEIPEEPQEQPTETPTQPQILDSGNRREFETGAVRDMQEGKGRCDLLPLDVIAQILGGENVDSVIIQIHEFMRTGDIVFLYDALELFRNIQGFDNETIILELAKHFEAGAKKYPPNNWKKGIKLSSYVDSAVRHYLKFLRGDTDEPHDRAFMWNIVCAIWTCEHKPELNDYSQEEGDD